MWGQILKDDRFARYTAPAGGSLNTSALVHSAETLADDLGAVDNRDKGTRIDLARVATQLHGLATTQHAHNHRHALARESTVAAADSRRTVEMLDDKLLDLKGLGTNDRADFAQVNALDGLVDTSVLANRPSTQYRPTRGPYKKAAMVTMPISTNSSARPISSVVRRLRIMARMSVPPVEAPISRRWRCRAPAESRQSTGRATYRPSSRHRSE